MVLVPFAISDKSADGRRKRENLSLSPSFLPVTQLARLGKDMKTPAHVVLSDTPHENDLH